MTPLQLLSQNPSYQSLGLPVLWCLRGVLKGVSYRVEMDHAISLLTFTAKPNVSFLVGISSLTIPLKMTLSFFFSTLVSSLNSATKLTLSFLFFDVCLLFNP